MRKQEKYITIKFAGERGGGGRNRFGGYLAGRLGGCKNKSSLPTTTTSGDRIFLGGPREIFMTHPQGPGGEIAVYSVRRQGQSNVVSGATPRSKLV